VFTKFASFGVTSSVLVPSNVTAAQGLAMVKQAHRATFDYEVRPGFLYVRSRAISSRCNDNFDEFPAEEIKQGYKTFIGKPVFVNHHNDNHRRARGVIIDAVLHEDFNPDGSPDTWAEVLMEVDAINFPKLADAIQKGHIDRTSMGTDVAYSICSACGNKASSPAEYCAHIPRQKGQRLYKADPKTGVKEGILIREICYGLSFFENSLLVEEPADPTAFFLGVDTSGVTKAASKTAHLDHEDFQMGPSKPGEEPTSHSHIRLSDEDREFYRQLVEQRNQDLELSEQAEKRVVNTKDHIDLMQHMIEAHDRYPEDHDFARKNPVNTDALGESDEDMDRDLTHAEMQKVHDHEHGEYPEDWPNATTLDGSHFHTARKTGARDQATCPHTDMPLTAHDQCPSCGAFPFENEKPCTAPWCVQNNEPFHTEAEHIDPSHQDPEHEDFASAKNGVDELNKRPDIQEDISTLDIMPHGPSKYSSFKIAQAGEMLEPQHPEDDFKVTHVPASVSGKRPEHYKTYLHPYHVSLYPPVKSTDEWLARYRGPKISGEILLGQGENVHEKIRKMRYKFEEPDDETIDQITGGEENIRQMLEKSERENQNYDSAKKNVDEIGQRPDIKEDISTLDIMPNGPSKYSVLQYFANNQKIAEQYPLDRRVTPAGVNDLIDSYDTPEHKQNTKVHENIVTKMRNGGYRAECSCGWFADSATQKEATQSNIVHLYQSGQINFENMNRRLRRLKRSGSLSEKDGLFQHFANNGTIVNDKVKYPENKFGEPLVDPALTPDAINRKIDVYQQGGIYDSPEKQHQTHEVTQMRKGDYRAECDCGWSFDHSDMAEAYKEKLHHLSRVGEACPDCVKNIVSTDPLKYQNSKDFKNFISKEHKTHDFDKPLQYSSGEDASVLFRILKGDRVPQFGRTPTHHRYSSLFQFFSNFSYSPGIRWWEHESPEYDEEAKDMQAFYNMSRATRDIDLAHDEHRGKYLDSVQSANDEFEKHDKRLTNLLDTQIVAGTADTHLPETDEILSEHREHYLNWQDKLHHAQDNYRPHFQKWMGDRAKAEFDAHHKDDMADLGRSVDEATSGVSQKEKDFFSTNPTGPTMLSKLLRHFAQLEDNDERQPEGYLKTTRNTEHPDFWAKPAGNSDYDAVSASFGLEPKQKNQGPWHLTRHPETRKMQIVDNQNKLVDSFSNPDDDRGAWQSARNIWIRINREHGHMLDSSGHTSHNSADSIVGRETPDSEGHSNPISSMDAQWYKPTPPFAHSTEDPKNKIYQQRAEENPAPIVKPENFSPSDEWHGPYSVVQHPEDKKFRVVDNQNRQLHHHSWDNQAHAEKQRDYFDKEQSGKEKAKGFAEKLWNGVNDIFDPGGTEESRQSDRNMRSAEELLTNYKPEHIKFHEDDPDDWHSGTPYVDVQHPSGYIARDYGGQNIRILHRATGRDEHDLVRTTGGIESDFFNAGTKPAGWSRRSLQNNLNKWVKENGQYAENHDRRIIPWQKRNGYSQTKKGFLDMAPEDTTGITGSPTRNKITDTVSEIPETDMFLKRPMLSSLVNHFKFANPMGGRGTQETDAEKKSRNKNREIKKCKICGEDIYKVEDGSLNPWQHDIPVGAGVTHQAVPDEDGSGAKERQEGVCVTCNGDIYSVNDGSVYNYVHKNDNGAGVPHQAIPRSENIKTATFADTSSLPHFEAIYARGQHPKIKEFGMHHKNIISMYDQATDEEKELGSKWYSDANEFAHFIGEGDSHKGAGIISAYSPMTGWGQNVSKALRSKISGKPVGALGDSVKKVGRIMDGEHYSTVLPEHFKTGHFADLIAHGGQRPNIQPDERRAAIDRHSARVMIGKNWKKISFDAITKALGTKSFYRDAVDMYCKAADDITKRERKRQNDPNFKLHPEQVQGITWLAFRRIHNITDDETTKQDNRELMEDFEQKNPDDKNLKKFKWRKNMHTSKLFDHFANFFPPAE